MKDEAIERAARAMALKHFDFKGEADLSYWGSGKDMRDVDELTATIVAAIEASGYPEALAETRAKLATAREALQAIMELPGEINLSNYSHDDACTLNTSFCEGYEIARAALDAIKEKK